MSSGEELEVRNEMFGQNRLGNIFKEIDYFVQMKQAQKMSANIFVGEYNLSGQHWGNLVNTDSISDTDLFI